MPVTFLTTLNSLPALRICVNRRSARICAWETAEWDFFAEQPMTWPELARNLHSVACSEWYSSFAWFRYIPVRISPGSCVSWFAFVLSVNAELVAFCMLMGVDSSLIVHLYFIQHYKVQVDRRFLNDLLLLMPVPRCFPPVHGSSLLIICPNIPTIYVLSFILSFGPQFERWRFPWLFWYHPSMWCGPSNSVFSPSQEWQCPRVESKSVVHGCVWFVTGHCYVDPPE